MQQKKEADREKKGAGAEQSGPSVCPAAALSSEGEKSRRSSSPRAFMLAGESSGSGKTTLSLAVLAALKKRGLKIQGFKCGPDLLDPLLAAEMSGRPSYNLDTFLAGDRGVGKIFSGYARKAEISVVEGVMGLFDGRIGERRPDGLAVASAASVAAVLELPVFLILDMKGRAQSALPVIRGFAAEHPRVNIAGVILNRISPMLAERLLPDLEKQSGLPILGALPELPELARGSRQLGLLSPFEKAVSEEEEALFARLGEECLQLGRMLETAETFSFRRGPLHGDFLADYPRGIAAGARLALARDSAFYFYDPLNLDLLRWLGVELLPFSPLEDTQLPEAADGLYLGGGYPELFAERLSGNRRLHAALKRAISDEQLPCIAEGGGRILLGRSLRLAGGEELAMAGVFDEHFEMTERLQNFGYAVFTAREDSLLFRRGESFPGNEFHYSRCLEEGAEEGAALAVCRGGGKLRFAGVADARSYRAYTALRAAAAGKALLRFALALKKQQKSRTEK